MADELRADLEPYVDRMDRLSSDPLPADWTPEPPLPLELCTGATPQCPHYDCPDGWHPGDAPNCSCTPDCAQLEKEV